jgi:hypothetical protein
MSEKKNESPIEFSFEDPITRHKLLEACKTNSDLDKQCFWISNQAFNAGYKLKDNSSYDGLKFGIPYPFETFYDYLEWSGALEEQEKAISYSYLYGISIIVCLNKENMGKLKGKPYFMEIENPLDKPAEEIKAFYPTVDGSGYWIHKYDDEGNPEIYKIEITDKNYEREPRESQRDAKIVFYVHSSRVVRFPCIQKDLSFAGTPKSLLTYHMARAKEIYIESVVNAAKNQSAGTVVRRVAGEAEMDELENINTTPSYQNRVYVMGTNEKLDEIMQIYIPDFKTTQFSELMLSINKHIASASNLSLRIYGEEDIACGIGEGGANFSSDLIRAEIKDLQSRYRKPIEHTLFLLGRKETSFEWNEPITFGLQKKEDNQDE